MRTEFDESERCFADATVQVREFVVQQLRAGRRADALSFALAFISTEVGLHVAHGRNPLGVVLTALRGVLAAADSFAVGRQPDASTGTWVALTYTTDALPKGTVLH